MNDATNARKPLKMTRLSTLEKLLAHLDELGVDLPVDADVEGGPDGPLAQRLEVGDAVIGNRFAILPMEGWDATPEGRPTDLVRRRWRRFGESGAKLIWGGEAYAVRPEARANPQQLCANPETEADLAQLRTTLEEAHVAKGDATNDLMIGLQLTHSGRYSRPTDAPAPRTAFRHPILDARVGIEDDGALLSDAELDDLIEDYVRIARAAESAGFNFVDVKACHGYLGHELLSARERDGAYGGDLAGRARFLLRTIEAVRAQAPSLRIGVRLSVFDLHPFAPSERGIGVEQSSPHRPFGASEDGATVDLTETHQLLSWLSEAGVELLCTTAGSPYYNPHTQRPAFYPPSDGYRPPEDPIVGVARQIAAVAEITERHPSLAVVGSAYTYLQEWLPNVAQAVVRSGGADAIGLGRMVLSYPELPRDVLSGRGLERPLICRTFSDCTTAPRNGLVSGCYPIDPFYKRRSEAEVLAQLKKAGARS